MIIYKATNIVNNKIYIGQTINSLEYRRDQHFRETKRKNRKNTYFHNAIAKYGEDSFTFEQIDSAKSIDELNEKEKYWISYYNSNKEQYGYNLDAGGRNGKKSKRTKRKIGDSSLLKWQNEEIAEKMLNGLRKGIEAWQQICKDNMVEFVCKGCGKSTMLPPWEAESKTYCSLECKKKHGGCLEVALKASEIAAQKAHEENIVFKKRIKETIIQWIKSNKELVINCPKNKISPTLQPLMDIINEKYNLIDIRSLFICFDVKNKKDFLQSLQNCIYEENIC